MRVLLIRPNSKIRSTFMPLGMGYIADAARKMGHEVSLLDARKLKLVPDKVVRRVQDVDPDVVGLSSIHFDKQETRDVVRALREAGVTVPVVLGGPLVSTSGEEMVGEGIVDVAVIGEGERVFTSYLDALGAGRGIDAIPGLIYRCDDEVRSSPPGPFLEDLNDRMPAWDLIEPQQYFTRFGRSTYSMLKKYHRSASIFTSRGCPFGCIYCHNAFGRKFRPHSVEAVLAEISMLKNKYGIQELEIVDDCFNLDLERAKKIAKGIIERGFNLGISFPNGLRVDRMDEELVDLLKDAGTYRIDYAVETASPRIQKLIHKNLDLNRAEELITYTAEQGIFILGGFMLGFPTETEEEMRMTVEYALRSKLHASLWFYVTPFPGTRLAERFLGSGSETVAIERMDYTYLTVNLSEVPDETLRRIAKEAYRKFHFSPGRMRRTFRVVPKNFSTVWSVIITGILSVRDMSNW